MHYKQYVQTTENLKKKNRNKIIQYTSPSIFVSSENWTIKARDARRITALEMKYMIETPGYTWADYKTNTEIAKGLNITLIVDKIEEYRRNWLQQYTECLVKDYQG